MVPVSQEASILLPTVVADAGHSRSGRFLSESRWKRDLQNRPPDLSLIVTAYECQRSCNPQVEGVLADAFAVEDKSVIRLGALAHEGGVPADVNQYRIVKMH